jgi:hypothetical protein
MRELNDFNCWAQSIINEAITEKTQQASPSIDRTIPIEKNIMYQAQRKYRDFAPDQALNLFLSDKLDDFDRRDLDQNKVINRQRQENERLRSQVGQMGQELQDLETRSAESDAELERLRSLSGGLRSDIEKRRVSGQEVQEILAQIETLKNKPGMDPKQYDELKLQVEKEIEDFRKNGVNPEKFAELQRSLEGMAQASELSKDSVQQVQNMLGKVEAGRKEVEAGKMDVMAKLQQLEKEQADFEKEAKEKEKEVEKKLIAAAIRAGRRGKPAEYKISKKRLDQLENDVIPALLKQADVLTKQNQEQAIININQDHEIEDTIEKLNIISSATGLSKKIGAPVVKPVGQMSQEVDQDEVYKAMTKGKEIPPAPFAQAQPETQVEPEPEPEMDQEQPSDVDKEPDYNLGDIGKLVGKFSRQPRNVKKGSGGIMSNIYEAEQEGEEERELTDEEYEELMEKQLLPALLNIYRSYYPDDLRNYTQDQIKDVMRYWAPGGLLIYGKDVEKIRTLKFLSFVHNKLKKIPPATPELFPPGSLPTPRKPLATTSPTANLSTSEPAKMSVTPRTPSFPPGPDDVSESKLPKKLSQQLDTLAENILGEQYSKYLR